ncbi:MAG TPA: SDR family oxidoreductase [Albitalea sp.]|nr:SDR family oxidoreductase [Albitalea sp.]
MKGIEGKVAVVTGGASGIGAAACRRFVEAGAQVVIGDINGDKAQTLAAELGAAALGVQFDAGDTEQVRALVEQGVAKFGRLDFLFNNAALMAPNIIKRDTNPVDIEFEVWDHTFQVNARGYLAGCKYAIPHMLKAGGGAIVMTGSGSGLRGDLANIAYGASKAAIMSMGRYVATMYGKQGIRCNVINPGLIVTEGGAKNVPPAMRDILLSHTLTPRVGVPDDIGAFAVYLCSDDGAFITGQSISVDGGLQEHMPYYADFTTGAAKWG